MMAALGCHVDNIRRDLSGKMYQHGGNTPQLCARFCRGYNYAGVQVYFWCDFIRFFTIITITDPLKYLFIILLIHPHQLSVAYDKDCLHFQYYFTVSLHTSRCSARDFHKIFS